MSVIQNLKTETLNLRKARSSLGPVMQFHLAEIASIGKDKGRETSEDEAIQYLKKTVQKLKENEFADQSELEVLEALLPKMATEIEVRAFIEDAKSSGLLDTSNKGAVMKAVRERFGALVDMKMVGGML